MSCEETDRYASLVRGVVERGKGGWYRGQARSALLFSEEELADKCSDWIVLIR